MIEGVIRLSWVVAHSPGKGVMPYDSIPNTFTDDCVCNVGGVNIVKHKKITTL